ncbi:Ultraviolet-B receptor UVR8 [Diplonema papillatum]|nr:Ultraviolet-B receptor UVR8 [Diplonema papillatum]
MLSSIPAAEEPADCFMKAYEFFIIGPNLEVPRIHAVLPTPYDYGKLCGVLEERLGMRVGAIEDIRVHDVEKNLWCDARDVEPREKAKLWVRHTDGPPMLSRELVPSGSKEFVDCRSLLEEYIKPFTASTPGARVSVSKVEQLCNAEHEHLYQTRRRELNDTENVALLTVGGDKDTLKNIATHGFQLPTEATPFGRAALVFGSNIRSVGEGGLPSPNVTNKLLLCEAALGIPKITHGAAPSTTLAELTNEGFDALIQPLNPHEPHDVEYTALYHPHQAIPRFIVTYNIEYIDPSMLCPVTGELYKLVEKTSGKLECLRCAVGEASKKSVEYEPVEDAASREKTRFLTQQDDLSSVMVKLKKEYADVEVLVDDANRSFESLVERVALSVHAAQDKLLAMGSSLLDAARTQHQNVRGLLDQHLAKLQTTEARAFEVHQMLSEALSLSSDVHFHKGLQRFKQIRAELQLPAAVLAEDASVQDNLAFLKHASVDVSAVLKACEHLKLDQPGRPPNSRRPIPLNESANETLSLHSNTFANTKTDLSRLSRMPPSEMLPEPASEPADPPSARGSSSPGYAVQKVSRRAPAGGKEWNPPPVSVDAGTVLSRQEAESGRRTRKILLAFGRNDEGQLGLGGSPMVNRLQEVALSAHACVVTMGCGAKHTVCAANDARIYAFGCNTHGQLGLGHKTAVHTPTPLFSLGGSDVRCIACGDEHTLLLTNGNAVYSWGRNDQGQLGLGHVDDQDTPWQVAALGDLKVDGVAAGANHSVCLAQGRTEVYTWGCNRHHQLGVGNAASLAYSTVPQRVELPLPLGERIACLAVGGFHTLVLGDARKSVFVWGRNDDSRLGLGHDTATATPRLLASLADPGDPIETVSAGRHGSCAKTMSGQLYSWGTGQLFPSTLPTVVSHLTSLSVPFCSVGTEHLLALTAEGQVFALGEGKNGQLGPPATYASQPRLLQLPSKLTRTRHRVLEVHAIGNQSFIVVAVSGSGPMYRP